MLKRILNQIRKFFKLAPPKEYLMDDESIKFLSQNVDFYRALNSEERKTFEQRSLLFIDTTRIIGHKVEVNQQDCLLIAASAIIPVWAFTDWHYFNLHTVVLVPKSFNAQQQFDQPDSNITGMVGSGGGMSGKMILSKPALQYGFSNARDKKNVGIHEFSHLIDMADGSCDGFPERFSKYAFFAPWIDFVDTKINEIDNKKSNINAYGATNAQEFFSVTTEYFFERPKMLKKKHPELYERLMGFYKQDMAAIEQEIKPKKNAPCPCGSRKKFKHCCLPAA